MRAMLWGGFVLAIAISSTACGAAPEPAASPEEEETAASPEGDPAASEPAVPKELDVEDVAARLEAGEDITLLDVRTLAELESDGAIEGYLHIPIDELEARIGEVPTDKPIVAY